MTGTELLKKAIEDGKLHYYQQTGSFAYVAEYEDGEQRIVFNALSAESARPGVPFEIVAEARWHEGQGNPYWQVINKETGEPEVASTDYDGNVIEQDGDIWF
jgi:hypothetical protein